MIYNNKGKTTTFLSTTCIDFHFKSKNKINSGINKKYGYENKDLLLIPGLLNPNNEVWVFLCLLEFSETHEETQMLLLLPFICQSPGITRSVLFVNLN